MDTAPWFQWRFLANKRMVRAFDKVDVVARYPSLLGGQACVACLWPSVQRVMQPADYGAHLVDRAAIPL